MTGSRWSWNQLCGIRGNYHRSSGLRGASRRTRRDGSAAGGGRGPVPPGRGTTTGFAHPTRGGATRAWYGRTVSSREWAERVARALPASVRGVVPQNLRGTLRDRFGQRNMWEPGFDHHDTPALRPGEVGGPPDFIGIGVQRAGTSRWYTLIMQHPGVSGRPEIHKERHFFTRFGIQSFGPSDVADYHAWFPHRDGTATGEWTPTYFKCAWAPELAARAAPDAKILLLLRDPVERFRSGLAYPKGGRSPAGAFQNSSFTRSLYASALVQWQAYFDPAQILVLQYEACVADASPQLTRTYEFLGIDPAFTPGNLRSSINATRTEKPGISEEARERLAREVCPDIEALAELVPTLDLSLWPSYRT